MSGFEALDQLAGDELLLRVGVGEGFLGLVAGGVEGGRALRLVGQPVGGVDVGADEVLELGLDRRLVGGGSELPRLLGGLLGELDDRVDHRLHAAVGEHDGVQHLVFRKLLGFGFDHHHGIMGAGDDQLELAVGDLLLGRVEDVLAFVR